VFARDQKEVGSFHFGHNDEKDDRERKKEQ
jgi:hypothetical protein